MHTTAATPLASEWPRLGARTRQAFPKNLAPALEAPAFARVPFRTEKRARVLRAKATPLGRTPQSPLFQVTRTSVLAECAHLKALPTCLPRRHRIALRLEGRSRGLQELRSPRSPSR